MPRAAAAAARAASPLRRNLVLFHRAWREKWMRLADVTGGVHEPDLIVQRYESQRGIVATLQEKSVSVKEKMKQLEKDVVAHIDERQRL